jgi:hypothetical protein
MIAAMYETHVIETIGGLHFVGSYTARHDLFGLPRMVLCCSGFIEEHRRALSWAQRRKQPPPGEYPVP